MPIGRLGTIEERPRYSSEAHVLVYSGSGHGLAPHPDGEADGGRKLDVGIGHFRAVDQVRNRRARYSQTNTMVSAVPSSTGRIERGVTLQDCRYIEHRSLS